MSQPPRAIVLLGAQRFDPTLGALVAEHGVDGPVATITAGWQERESDDQELHEHLGRQAVKGRVLGEEVTDLRQLHIEGHDPIVAPAASRLCRVLASGDERPCPSPGGSDQVRVRGS
jgi:hypothetical protein